MANYQNPKDIFIQRKTTIDTFEEYPLIVSPNSILLTNCCNDLVMINTQSLILPSASYSLTASYALNGGSGGGIQSMISISDVTASVNINSDELFKVESGSLVLFLISSLGHLSASVISASLFFGTASYALNTDSASFSSTASYSITSSFALNAGTLLSTGSTYPITSSVAITSSNANSASYALTASYALNGGSGTSVATSSLIATGSVTASVNIGADTFKIISGSSTHLYVSSGGNLGIGTTSPSNKLDVVGNISCSAITASIISTGTSLVIKGSSDILNLTSGSSAITITQSLSQSNMMGASIYGVSLNQTFTNTTASQTQTALRLFPTFSGSYTGSNTANIIADFGAVNVGTQFSVNDITSGSIYMVNDVSGLPIIEALSDWQVNIYDYPNVIFNKSGSYLTLGNVATPTSSITLKSDYIFDKGVGVTYKQVQVSGSTYGAVTSSIYNLVFGNISASVYISAIVTGYDTGSNDVISGDVKATVKYKNGVASIIGTVGKYSNSETDVTFNLTASSNSASLMVYGLASKYYKWGSTITTQII